MRRFWGFALFVLTLIVLAAPTSQAQSDAVDLVGAWSPEEDYFRIGILVEQDEAGALRAYFSPDGLTRGAPLSSVAVRGDSVFFEAAAVGARFRGAFVADRPAIHGTYTQGDASVPLTFVRATPTASRSASDDAQPWQPAEPVPYTAEDVEWESESPSVRLAGTLTLPDGPGPHPAVILIPGTGDNDRDFEVYGHRPFLVLADRLTRQGIAVLRYDERGVGGSGGDPEAASFDDEARDVAAGMRYLRDRVDIDADQVGLIGHSVGGATVPYVHDGMEQAAFLVLLMAPAAPMQELFEMQGARTATANGASPEEAEAFGEMGRAIVRAAAADTDSLTAAAAMETAYVAAGFRDDMWEAAIRLNTSRNFRDLMRHDPTPTLRRIDVPVLAVYGRMDAAVPPDENAARMTAALAASPSPDATVRVLDHLNHYLQSVQTARDEEAAATETEVSGEFLRVVADWVAERVTTGW